MFAGLDVCGFASLRVNLFFVAVIEEEQRVPLVKREAVARVGKGRGSEVCPASGLTSLMHQIFP